MPLINHYIANSTGELDGFKELISESLHVVIPVVESELNADEIDIIFLSAANHAIPELGIGGNSPGPNHVYISFDPKSDKITQDGLDGSLFHEIHHCMRWRNPGYGKTLGQTMVSEGLACLYEEQHSGHAPIYAEVDLSGDQIKMANEILGSQNYDRSEWFFGSREIVRWFGYSYGYRICRDHSFKVGKTAAELVHVPANVILESVQD